MKNLRCSIFIFVLLMWHCARAQTFPTFTITSFTTTGLPSPPYDSLSYVCNGSTMNVSLFRYTQIGIQPKTTLILSGDTLKFTLQDTALTVLTLDLIMRFNYSLAGLTQKYYFVKFFNKLYVIDCRYVGIDKYPQDKIYTRVGNIIKINYPNGSTTKIYDLSGKVLLSSTSKVIDLNEFNLSSGIYIIQIVTGESMVREKFFVE